MELNASGFKSWDFCLLSVTWASQFLHLQHGDNYTRTVKSFHKRLLLRRLSARCLGKWPGVPERDIFFVGDCFSFTSLFVFCVFTHYIDFCSCCNQLLQMWCLKTSNLFSHGPGGQKSKIKVLAAYQLSWVNLLLTSSSFCWLLVLLGLWLHLSSVFTPPSPVYVNLISFYVSSKDTCDWISS